MESNSMSLDFWPGTEIRRSTHNGFTMGLTGERSGQFLKALKPSPKARANPGKRGVPMRPIEQLTLDGALVRLYPSIADAARAMGVPDTSIARVACGTRKTTRGYRWRYAEEQA
jgi:hypothetical protein